MIKPEEASALNPTKLPLDEHQRDFEMTSDPPSDTSLEIPPGEGNVSWHERFRRHYKCCRQRYMFLIVGVILGLSMSLIYNLLTWFATPELCTSSNCQLASQRISSILNPHINPCENFYAFACGKRTGENFGQRKGLMEQSESYIQKIVPELIEDPAGTTESVAVNNARKMYYTCMSNGFRSSNDEDVRLLTEVTSSVLDHGNNAGAGLERILAESFAFNVQAIFQIGVVKDEETRKFHLKLSKPDIRKVYVNETFLETWRRENHYKEVLRALLPGLTKEEADDVIGFESQLRRISLKSFKQQIRQFEIWRRNTDETITLRELTQRYPQVKWIEVLGHLCEILGRNVKISSDVEVAISHPTYFQDVADLIGKSNDRTVKNYVGWNFIRFFQPFLGKSFLQRSISMDEHPNPVSEDTVASHGRHYCIQIVKDGFEHALAYLYAIRNPMDKKKEIVEEIYYHIKEEFLGEIGNEKWIPKGMEEFKDNLQKKLKATKIHIGYPDYFTNATAVDLEYAGLQLNHSSLIHNLLTQRKFQMSKALADLEEGGEKHEEWVDSLMEVNAFNVPSRNEIVIPAGILSSPMLEENFPMVWNFASVGTIVAHELAHDFDTLRKMGLDRHYDHQGNLTYWWPEEVETSFRDQTSCLLRIFKKFKLPGHGNLNENITLAENMCDNTAVRLAFRGYEAWARKSKITEPSLPGLEYNIQQIFHIVYGQTYCEDFKANVFNEYNFYDHSPGEFRVTAAIQNDENFGQIFNCPLGSQMNPTEKCSIWA